jgi:hypothetical protein
VRPSRPHRDHTAAACSSPRYDEIVSIDREPTIRIGPYRAIRLNTHAAGSLLVAAIAGIATQCDLLYRLQDALATISL